MLIDAKLFNIIVGLFADVMFMSWRDIITPAVDPLIGVPPSFMAMSVLLSVVWIGAGGDILVVVNSNIVVKLAIMVLVYLLFPNVGTAVWHSPP